MARKKKLPDFKINKVRKFIFKHNLYNIVWKKKRFPGNHFGECDNTEDLHNKKEIRISPRAQKNQKELLATLLDEIIHAYCWPLDNDVVGEISDGMADFLWEVGYRLPPKKAKLPNKTD
jgi:hypothetical protein